MVSSRPSREIQTTPVTEKEMESIGKSGPKSSQEHSSGFGNRNSRGHAGKSSRYRSQARLRIGGFRAAARRFRPPIPRKLRAATRPRLLFISEVDKVVSSSFGKVRAISLGLALPPTNARRTGPHHPSLTLRQVPRFARGKIDAPLSAHSVETGRHAGL